MRRLAAIILVAAMATPGYTDDLTRTQCRASQDFDTLMQCVDAGIYDPCDEDHGKWFEAACIMTRRELIDRRIANATQKIQDRLVPLSIEKSASVNDEGITEPIRDHVDTGNTTWRKFVWEHCLFLNELDSASMKPGERLGWCEVRLMGQRADELESILGRLVKRSVESE